MTALTEAEVRLRLSDEAKNLGWEVRDLNIRPVLPPTTFTGVLRECLGEMSSSRSLPPEAQVRIAQDLRYWVVKWMKDVGGDALVKYGDSLRLAQFRDHPLNSVRNPTPVYVEYLDASPMDPRR